MLCSRHVCAEILDALSSTLGQNTGAISLPAL